MTRHYKREREKARGKNTDLSHVPSKRNEEIKSGTSGCGSFVVPYLLLFIGSGGSYHTESGV